MALRLTTFVTRQLCVTIFYIKMRILDYKKTIQKYPDRVITLHGAFFSLIIHSNDPDIAKISKNKTYFPRFEDDTFFNFSASRLFATMYFSA